MTLQTPQELAGIVAVVSLAMIGISILLLRPCFDGFLRYFRALSPSERKAGLPIFVLSHLPTVWVVIFAGLSVKYPDYMPDIFVFVIVGTVLLVALVEAGIAIKRRIKKQTFVKVETYALIYSIALSYLLLSVFLNIFALIGVSATMLSIDVGLFTFENFEWGRWFLYIAIFEFSVGIIETGFVLALEKVSHKDDSGQEKH